MNMVVCEDSMVFRGIFCKWNGDRASLKAHINDLKKSSTKDRRSIVLLFSSVWMIAKVIMFYFK